MTQPRLHHVGYVVRSIAETAPAMARALSLGWDSQIIHDPLQLVNVTFLPANVAGSSTIELVEPAGRRSPVLKFAESGGGLHHVCYEVEDLEAQIAASRAAGGTLVRVPMPAVAFAGRKIAWVVTAERLLVEYLQAAREPSSQAQNDDEPIQLLIGAAK
jgi:methylmalonyl-CoA/ethylmalonyl-CoA epimerase